MCRMMAVRCRDAPVRQELVSQFRTMADRSYTGPERLHSHRDGWGIVGLTSSGLTHLGRAPMDASRDPNYAGAVKRASQVVADSVTIGHVRNGSVGGRQLENTHPFIHGGWAFCHNGTIHGIHAPAGAKPEGATDSEAYFLHLLGSIRRHRSVEAAIRETVERVQTQHRYSSLTFLLTNGHDLYGYREVGDMYGSCGTKECALEHYVLGHGTLDEAIVAIQEPEAFPRVRGWKSVPNGGLLVLKQGEPPNVVDLVRPVVA